MGDIPTDIKRRSPPRTIYFPSCNAGYGDMSRAGFSVHCDRAAGHSGWHHDRVAGVRWNDPWSKAGWRFCAWSDCHDPFHVVDEREDGNGQIHVCPGFEGAHHWPKLTRTGATGVA